MADSHIGGLGSATTPLSSSDKLIVEQSGVAKQVAFSDLDTGGWGLVSSASASGTEIVFNTENYRDFIIIGQAITTAASCFRVFRFSTDGGSTYHSTGYFKVTSDPATPASSGDIGHTGAGLSGSGLHFMKLNANLDGPVKLITYNIGPAIFSGSTDKIDRVKFYTHNGTTFTGGTVYFLAR